MEWAGRANHLGGLPRKIVFMAVGAFAKTVANFLNTTDVHNADTLIRLVHSRPRGVPLLTVSNHMSTSVSSFAAFFVFFFLINQPFFHLLIYYFHEQINQSTGWMIRSCGDSRVFPP